MPASVPGHSSRGVRSAQIMPLNALAYAAEDLVWNSAFYFGEIGRGDCALSFSPNQNNFVAHGGSCYTGHIQQRQIHANVANNRRVLPVHKGVAAIRKSAV